MVAEIEWLRVFIDHYPYLEYLVIFLGAAFGGELVLLALAFLSAQAVFSVYVLIILSFLGTICSDALWFMLGKTQFVQKLITHRHADKTITVINKVVHRLSNGRHLVALIIAKFLVGTRILMIMYVGTKIPSFKHFIRYDAIAILVWLSVIIPIGFLSGLGFIYFAEILENLYVAIGFILVIIILGILAEMWFKNRFIKMNE